MTAHPLECARVFVYWAVLLIASACLGTPPPPQGSTMRGAGTVPSSQSSTTKGDEVPTVGGLTMPEIIVDGTLRWCGVGDRGPTGEIPPAQIRFVRDHPAEALVILQQNAQSPRDDVRSNALEFLSTLLTVSSVHDRALTLLKQGIAKAGLGVEKVIRPALEADMRAATVPATRTPAIPQQPSPSNKGADVPSLGGLTMPQVIRIMEWRPLGPGGPSFEIDPAYTKFVRDHPAEAMAVLEKKVHSPNVTVRCNAYDFLTKLLPVVSVHDRALTLLKEGLANLANGLAEENVIRPALEADAHAATRPATQPSP